MHYLKYGSNVFLAIVFAGVAVMANAQITHVDTGEVLPGSENIRLRPGQGLSGASFPFGDFSDVDLSNARIDSNSHLENSSFRNANLSNAVIDASYVNGADFTGANVSGAELRYLT